MHPDRGLQAAVGIVLAFAMLWTVAILIPDNVVSAGPLGLAEDGTSGSVKVMPTTSPHIVPRKIVTLIDSESTSHSTTQSRILFEPARPSATETKSKPAFTQSQKTRKPLFPAYVWYLTALFVYKTRNFVKKRERTQYDYDDESFFRKSGLDSSLKYGYGLEFEDPNDDFISVDHSNYGSTSRWTPDLDKFDLELELSDSQI